MNWAHVHLLVNHVPILGYGAAAALALAALLGRDAQVWVRAAIVAIAVSFPPAAPRERPSALLGDEARA